MQKIDISALGDVPKKQEEKRGAPRYSNEVKERVLAEVMLTHDPFGVAKKANISYVIVKKWVRESIRAPIIDEVRRQQCKTFIKNAWEAIGNGLKVINEKIGEANAKEAAIVVGILVDKVLRASTSVTIEKEVTGFTLESLPDEALDSLIDKMLQDKRAKFEEIEDAEILSEENEDR